MRKDYCLGHHWNFFLIVEGFAIDDVDTAPAVDQNSKDPALPMCIVRTRASLCGKWMSQTSVLENTISLPWGSSGAVTVIV